MFCTLSCGHRTTQENGIMASSTSTNVQRVNPADCPPVTRENVDAYSVFHYTTACSRTPGPRGGAKTTVERWRANSSLKTWKTRPQEWELSLVYGMGKGKAQHMKLNHTNAQYFHHEKDCPLGLR
jgi:hypothetical protein